ncbi:coiled-coil domain-containing protein 6-like [Engraulis encrasicolus]|uniref:coiled-coil domain-containing protein 6-like n=1 Tax=Engraulis encrasicolus TaxID=184585 RepID=UPI002FD63E56
MLRSGTPGSITTITDIPEESERSIRRLRLTLHPVDSTRNNRSRTTHTDGKLVNGSWEKRNGFIRERPAGRESPANMEERRGSGSSSGGGGSTLTNGVSREAGSDGTLTNGRSREEGPKVYGVVRRGGDSENQEVMAREWSVNHLQQEMKYIREVRDSLEKVRERMYGQFGGMQQSVEKLSREIKVEVSQEASAQALRDLNTKLQQQYDQRLQQEQRRHREEIETLQAQIDVYVKRIEELERNAREAEAKIAERDQRILELQRLTDAMGKEKNHLHQKLQETEQKLQQLSSMNHRDPAVIKRERQLEEESSDLKERIKHLNDMVFCQQRKVKGMIEEVEHLRAKVAQKDAFISDLLDRLAIVECENNELEDKLKYYLSVQSSETDRPSTREIGVGCDLPVPRSDPPEEQQPYQQASPYQSYSPPPPPAAPAPSHYTLPRMSRPNPNPNPIPIASSRTNPVPPPPITPTRSNPIPPSSRLTSTLLRYSPVQYSQYLRTLPPPAPRDHHYPDSPDYTSPYSDSSDDDDDDPPMTSYAPIARTAPPQLYTPFMRLMDISAKIDIQ